MAAPAPENPPCPRRQLVARTIWNRIGGRGAQLPDRYKDGIWRALLLLPDAHVEHIQKMCQATTNSVSAREDTLAALKPYAVLHYYVGAAHAAALRALVPYGASGPLQLAPLTQGEIAAALRPLTPDQLPDAAAPPGTDSESSESGSDSSDSDDSDGDGDDDDDCDDDCDGEGDGGEVPADADAA